MIKDLNISDKIIKLLEKNLFSYPRQGDLDMTSERVV